MTRTIALYLPQFHPIEENDRWYGKGFTEWRSVAGARPLFRGHNQPRIPADLGFYDLRLPETRYAQANLAKEHGVDGFAYYHYWFGNGKRLLERPFQSILLDKDYTFPFMLHWANGSWYRKLWRADKTKDTLLVEQKYLGRDDAINHFYTLLPAFTDPRYMRIEGKILFTIDSPLDSEQLPMILDVWRELASKEGIGDFFFLAHIAHNQEWLALKDGGIDYYLRQQNGKGYDGLIDSQYRKVLYLNLREKSKFRLRQALRLPNVYSYRDAISKVVSEIDRDSRVFPEVFPNFDHSPRSKGRELIYVGDSPELFRQYMCEILQAIRDKPDSRQIVFVRAWNEWGEGNYLEPDTKNGLSYLEALRNALEK